MENFQTQTFHLQSFPFNLIQCTFSVHKDSSMTGRMAHWMSWHEWNTPFKCLMDGSLPTCWMSCSKVTAHLGEKKNTDLLFIWPSSFLTSISCAPWLTAKVDYQSWLQIASIQRRCDWKTLISPSRVHSYRLGLDKTEIVQGSEIGLRSWSSLTGSNRWPWNWNWPSWLQNVWIWI